MQTTINQFKILPNIGITTSLIIILNIKSFIYSARFYNQLTNNQIKNTIYTLKTSTYHFHYRYSY